jgi:hypothetical protein
MAQGLENLKGKYYIEIYSFSNASPVASGNNTTTVRAGDTTIKFPAFLTEFSDNYKSDWASQTVIGKMDPIATFKNTTRSISVGFDIPSESLEVAKQNSKNIDYLIKGLYPIYTSGPLGTQTMASPPMFRVKLANLITNTLQTTSLQNPPTSGSNPTSSNTDSTLKTGLLCYIPGFTYNPKIDSGFFVEDGKLFPKLMSATLNLNIIHEHALGKEKGADGNVTNRSGFANFPHGSYEISQQGQGQGSVTITPEGVVGAAAAGAAQEVLTGQKTPP